MMICLNITFGMHDKTQHNTAVTNWFFAQGSNNRISTGVYDLGQKGGEEIFRRSKIRRRLYMLLGRENIFPLVYPLPSSS